MKPTLPKLALLALVGLGAAGTTAAQSRPVLRPNHTLYLLPRVGVSNYVGEYATSLEMAGASISLLELDDARLELLRAPATSPFFQEG